MAHSMKSFTPIGDRFMSISEISGVTSATIDPGIRVYDAITVQSRTGSSDNTMNVARSSGKLIVSNINASATYMVTVIGV